MTREWGAADWVALAAITMVAAGLRGFRLTVPSLMVFDEYHYTREACWYVRGAADCGLPLQHTESHPPLAKWFIGWGIQTFGHTPLGWRIASVVAGILTVALLYLLARKLLRSTVGAVLASGFLAIDPVHFVHSRIAMPDVFSTLFAVAAILFCVYDREALSPTGERGRSLTDALFGHRWRVAAGVALGAATAVKWSSLPFLIAVPFLTVAWQIAARRADGGGAAVARAAREEGPSIVFALVLLPFLIYVATYIGTPPAARASGLVNSWIGSVVRQHIFMVQFQLGLSITERFQTSPWWWVRLGRPAFYFTLVDELGYRLVLAFGNPTLLITLPAIAYIAVRAVRQRAVDPADMTILTCFVLAYGFLLATAGRRPAYMYYLLTAIPFMYLAPARLAATLTGSYRATLAMRAWIVLS
ncbi:MAG: phospholipid carrier-dependent glycosyltransferase, partial [bacterium]